jgi:tetratricopeptide (TPR) repeat protein
MHQSLCSWHARPIRWQDRPTLRVPWPIPCSPLESSVRRFPMLKRLAASPARLSTSSGWSLAQKLGSTFWIATLAAHLGQAYILNRNLPKAQAALQAVMSREQHPLTMAERDIALAWGELLLAQGEPAMALQMVEELLTSAPGMVSAHSMQPIPHLLKLQGEALIALSKLDEAVAALEGAKLGALARNARPILWTIHRSLGRAYQLLQRKDQARQENAAGRQLIAKGKTSREIADLLVVSERTAEGHVSNILGKLNFSSRAQIAVWVVERGLAKH